MPTRAEIFNEALTVLEDNPRANIFNEAQEELDRKTDQAVRTFELLNNPEKEAEDFVSPDQADALRSYFERAENSQAEREKFNEVDMLRLSTGMPDDVAQIMHSELKADGTIDAIKGEWTGERPGFFKRGFKKFGRSFVNTLVTIRTKTPFGKSMTEMSVLVERLTMAKEAGLMPQSGRLKEFFQIPEKDLEELFGGESLGDHIKRKEIERAAETPGLEITATPEAITGKEKAADVAGNIAGFVAKLALTKKAIGGTPGFAKSLVTWETVNLVEGGTPGKGAAMFVALRGIDKIPVKGVKGFFVKTGTQSGLFAGVTAAAGGTQEEVLTAAAIPWALRAVDLAARTGVKLSRKALETRAVKNLRTIGKENGVDFTGVPDETLKFLIGKSRQARFWNKQFDKGKISEETLNKRLDLIRKDVEPALRAIAKQQPKAEAKPGEIVPIVKKPAEAPKTEPTQPATVVTPVIPAIERVQPAKPLEAKQGALTKEISRLENELELRKNISPRDLSKLRLDPVEKVQSRIKDLKAQLEAKPEALLENAPDWFKLLPGETAQQWARGELTDIELVNIAISGNKKAKGDARHIVDITENEADGSRTARIAGVGFKANIGTSPHDEAVDMAQQQGLRDLEHTREAANIPIGIIPGTDIEFDNVGIVSGNEVGFFRNVFLIHKIKAENETEAIKLVKDSRKLLSTDLTQPTPTEQAAVGKVEVFHGTDAKITGPIKPSKSGFVFVATTEDFAKGFGKNITKFEIPAETILQLKNPDGSFTEAGKEITDKLGFDNAGNFTKDALPEAEKRGFLAIQRGNEIITRPEVLAQPTPTEQALKITSPDESLLDERRGIVAVKPKDRTPTQIERLTEIETELIDRNIEQFPVKDITDKVRKTEIQKVTKEITEHEAFKVIAEGAEAVPELEGVFNVGKSEMSDVIARFEGRPEILRKFNLQETGGSRWDTIAGEVSEQSGIAIDTLDEFMDAVELFVESKTKGPGVNQAFLDKALESENFPDLELLDTKHELLQEGETAAIINQELTDAAEQLGIPVEDFLLPVTGVTEAQRRADILKEVTKEKLKRKVKNIEKEAIVKASDRAFKEKTPIFVTEKDGKFSVSKRRPTKGEFVRVTPPEPGQLEGKTERLIAGPTPEEVVESKKLKQQINIVAKTKGFTKKKFNEIKMQHGGTKKLTRMDIEQLKSVLKGVKRARPKIVNQKTVVTPKTERQIGTLRENLTKSELMNEDEWEKILAEETGGKLPKYISEKAFITQSQGRKVLAHMHDTAEKLRATESFRKAIEADEEITLEFEKIKPVENVIGAKNPSRLLSMRFFIEKMSERTGEPLYPIWQDMVFTHQRLMRERRKTLTSLEAMPGFTDVATDPKAMQRISDFIASKSKLKNRPKSPEDITSEEEAIAGRIEGIYKQYELHARIGKFFQHIDDLTKVPQYQQHKKAIDLALDIYNTEGLDALFDYLNTQPWGIIGSGYEPMESTIRGVKTHELPLIAVPKTHIKERGIEYTTQERNILQRTQSYMRQMDFLAFLQPKIKSLVRSVNETLDLFDKPQDISSAIGTFLDNLKKTNNEDGLVEEVFRKIYSQAITTLVLSDPIKIVRNFLQNFAFNQDRLDLINPRNKQLTDRQIEFMETFVHQDRVMMSDWAFAGEEPFDFPIIGQHRLGINELTKWVQRRTLYPASDRLNRTWSFWAKINRIRRAFTKDQSLEKKMQGARFSDMQQSEQQYALGVLARDGVDAMAMYVAKVHTDDTHFMYAREQRSPAEQTKVGKLALNLALFKRAALEKVILQAQKVVEPTSKRKQVTSRIVESLPEPPKPEVKTTGKEFQKRRRAAYVFVTTIAASTVVNLLWKKFTGKKFGAYDFINFLQFDAGGLELGAVNKISDIYNSMLDAGRGDAKALSALAIAIPASADMFIPFYDLGLRFIEAYMDAENIDRVPFRKMREMIDKEYKSRGIQEVDRNLVEKLQFAFTKGKVQKETKKRKIGKRD